MLKAQSLERRLARCSPQKAGHPEGFDQLLMVQGLDGGHGLDVWIAAQAVIAHAESIGAGRPLFRAESVRYAAG